MSEGINLNPTESDIKLVIQEAPPLNIKLSGQGPIASQVSITNFPENQNVTVTNTVPVSGTVHIFPPTSGTNYVHVDNYPTVQTVQFNPSQTVGVSNFPANQLVTLTNPTTVTISGIENVTVTNTVSTSGTVGGTINVGNLPSNQPVTITNTIPATISGVVTTVAASGTLNAHVDNFPTVQTVAVQSALPTTITNTVSVSGIVTSASGTLNSHVDNWPTIQTVNVANQPIIQTVSGAVTIVSGSSVNVGNFPVIQTISGTVALAPNTSISGSLTGNVTANQGSPGTAWPITVTSGTSNVNIGNFPTIQEVLVVNPTSAADNVNITNPSISVTQGTNPWTISGAVTSVSGTLNSHVDNWPTIQSVSVKNPITIASGTSNVNIGNFPTIQDVELINNPLNVVLSSGIPAAYTISGSITSTSGTFYSHIDNWPTIQTVNVANQTTIQTISGAITSVSGTLQSHIDNWPTVQTVSVQSFPGIQTISGSVTLTPNTVISGSLTGNITANQGTPGPSPWPVTVISGVEIINRPPTSAVTQSTSPWTVSGGITNLLGNTLAVSGTITNFPAVTTSGIQHTLIDNFPTVQTVALNGVNSDASGNLGVNIKNSPTVGVTSVLAASGVQNVHVDNYPTIQSVAITDGTYTADVVLPQGGQGSQLMAPSHLTVPFSTTTAQAVASTDCANMRYVSVHITGQGTNSNVAFQTSNDNVNWISQNLITSTSPGNSQGSSSNASTGILSGIVVGRYFRLNVTGISAGTTAGVIEFFSFNPTPSIVAAAVQGIGAEGGAISGNPVRVGGTDGTNIRTFRTTTSGNLQTYGAALANSNSTAYESSRLVKASSGTLYEINGFNSLGQGQYIMIFDSASIPGNGTTPVVAPISVAGNSNFGISFGIYGRAFANGIAISNSTTTPTLTAGEANCFYDAQFL